MNRTPKRMNFQLAENSSCACERSLRLDFLSLLLIRTALYHKALTQALPATATATADGGACDIGHHHHKQKQKRKTKN